MNVLFCWGRICLLETVVRLLGYNGVNRVVPLMGIILFILSTMLFGEGIGGWIKG
ncbi:MarC family protein [Enterobacter asburiae]